MKFRRAAIRFAVQLTVAVGLLFAPATEAVAQKKSVVVGKFTGRGSARIRRTIVRVLKKQRGIGITSKRRMDRAFRRLGVRVGKKGDYARVARSINVSAFVEGSVKRRGRTWRTRITVRGSNGAVIGRATFTSKNPRRMASVIKRRFWRELGRPIRRARPPSSVDDDSQKQEDDEEDRASESDEPRRVAVPTIRGRGGSKVRAAVRTVLRDRSDVEFITNKSVRRAADDLDADVSTVDGRREIAKKLRISAWVTGSSKKRGRSYRATLSVENGKDGDQLGRARFSRRSSSSLARSVKATFWKELGPAILRSDVWEEKRKSDDNKGNDEDEDEDEDSGEYETEDDESASGRGPSPLYVTAQLALFNRNLEYNDDLFGTLREYNLGLGPAVGFDLQWFPVAHFEPGSIFTSLGLDLRWSTSFGLKSSDSDGSRFPTSSTWWHIGARWRQFAGPFELTGLLGYGQTNFSIDAIDANNPAPDVPDVSYGYFRIGGEARWVIADVISLGLDVAVLPTLSTGQIGSEDWFPNASALGFEFGLKAGYSFVESLEVFAGFSYRRFGLSLNSEPGDDLVAGGALDEFAMGLIGLTWRWPGNDLDPEGDPDDDPANSFDVPEDRVNRGAEDDDIGGSLDDL